MIRQCERLSSLPKCFAKLKNLRHLDISDIPELKKMPLGIAGLRSLQTLSKVIVEEADGLKISDLKDLSDLQGHISVIGLEKVIEPIQAKNANLHQKKALDVLEMKWSDEFDDSRNEMNEYEVLKELRPHPKLKKLKILNYKGTGFPSWFNDPSFDRLSELMLCGCRSTHLPTLGSLRSLRELFVEKMSEVKTVGFESLAPTSSYPGIAFPSLEVLKLDNMQGWQKWSINIDGDHGTLRSFPRLHKIFIKCCPKLAKLSIRSIPSLQVLYIEECSISVLRSMVGLSSSLVKLQIRKVKGFTQLHGEDLMHLEELKHLQIVDCDELRYLWEMDSEACKSLVSLQKLKVRNCKKLVSSLEKEVGFGISMKSLKQVEFSSCNTLESYNCPNNVERLTISDCGSIKSLTFSRVQEHQSSVSESIVSDCDHIQPMSRLTSLHILECKNLKSFPHEHLHSLTALEKMEIDNCPSMDYCFPCGLWPPNLRRLRIGGLNKPMSEWGVQNFPTSLVELYLFGQNSGVVSFAVADDVRNTSTITTPSSSSSFLLPPSLVSLYLYEFEDVESFSRSYNTSPALKHFIFQIVRRLEILRQLLIPAHQI